MARIFKILQKRESRTRAWRTSCCKFVFRKNGGASHLADVADFVVRGAPSMVSGQGQNELSAGLR